MARTKSYLLSLVTKNIKISNSNRLNNEFIETKIKINNCWNNFAHRPRKDNEIKPIYFSTILTTSVSIVSLISHLYSLQNSVSPSNPASCWKHSKTTTQMPWEILFSNNGVKEFPITLPWPEAPLKIPSVNSDTLCKTKNYFRKSI
jgi:hypothetical protein